jgi:RNA polymerase sigma factor (sigma-70 family)
MLTERDVETLFIRYAPRFRSMATRILRDLHDREAANDAVQDAFLLIWSNRFAFDGKSTIYTWAYQIAKNAALTLLRKRNARRAGLHVELPSALPVIDNPENGILARQLVRLAPVQSRPALLGMLHDDQATLTNTDKVRRFRAVESIRKVIRRKAA